MCNRRRRLFTVYLIYVMSFYSVHLVYQLTCKHFMIDLPLHSTPLHSTPLPSCFSCLISFHLTFLSIFLRLFYYLNTELYFFLSVLKSPQIHYLLLSTNSSPFILLFNLTLGLFYHNFCYPDRPTTNKIFTST